MRPYLTSGPLSLLRHAALVCLLGTSAQAQVSGWLDFNGEIPGESQSASHPDWIEIQGFNLGGELKALKPGTLGLTKLLDRSSPRLHQACAQGTPYARATLDLHFASAVTKENPGPARLELENVFVSSISASSTADQTPLEAVELAFGRIVYTYVEKDKAEPQVVNFDFRTQTGDTGTGTNPDTDNDGLPDSWEQAYGLNVGLNDANADADGDGLTNLQEYQLGTHPKSSTSFFKAALSPAAGPAGLFQLTWNSVIGKTYLIEWTPDLATPFTTLRTVTATAATSTEDIVNTGNLGFYRVRPQ